MNEINSTNYLEFLKRFDNCYDAVFIELIIHQMTGTTPSYAALVLSAVDNQGKEPAENLWVNIVIYLYDLFEYRLSASEKYMLQVLSDGLEFYFNDNDVYIDLLPDTPPPRSLSLEEVRKSGFMLAGRTCKWELQPYSELGLSIPGLPL